MLVWVPAICVALILFAILMVMQRRVLAEDAAESGATPESAAPKLRFHFAPRSAQSAAPKPVPVSAPTPALTPAPSAAPASADEEPVAALPLDLWIKLVDRVPHLAILGPTDSGKTTLAEAILRKLLEVDASRKAVIIDPKWRKSTPPKWGGLPASMLDDEGGYSQVEQTLRGLFHEFRLRIKRAQQAEPLGDDIVIIWDEINDAMEEIAKTAGVMLRRGLRIWREYRMKLILFPQSDRVEALGLKGHGDAKQNLLWIYIADAALDKARELRSQRLVGDTFVQVLKTQERPAIMVFQAHAWIIDRTQILELSRQPIDASRAWQAVETSRNEAEIISASATSVSPVAIIQNNDQGPFQNVDFEPLARLVRANLVGETKLLETAFGVKAGSSKEYQAVREQLKEALRNIDRATPPTA